MSGNLYFGSYVLSALAGVCFVQGLAILFGGRGQ